MQNANHKNPQTKMILPTSIHASPNFIAGHVKHNYQVVYCLL